jgi:hypothetical protein
LLKLESIEIIYENQNSIKDILQDLTSIQINNKVLSILKLLSITNSLVYFQEVTDIFIERSSKKPHLLSLEKVLFKFNPFTIKA